MSNLLKGKEAFFPFAVITGLVSILLVLQPDVSTLGVIGLTGIIMYFVAGTPWWHTPFMLTGGLIALLAVIQLAPYRFSRLKVFLDPLLDPEFG